MRMGKRLATILVVVSTANLCVAAEEDCLALPLPSGIDRFFNSQKQKNFDACVARNQARSRENVRKASADGQLTVDSARNSCKAAIRKMSMVPDTLSFDSVRPYELIRGTKALGVYHTDGGYAAEVTGSDARGSFNVTCYMDKSFSITNVKRGF